MQYGAEHASGDSPLAICKCNRWRSVSYCKMGNSIGNFSIEPNYLMKFQGYKRYSQPPFTCTKLTIETIKHGLKYVKS